MNENGEVSSSYRSRDIPWLPIVRFHKEIVARAEEGFFSLNGNDQHSERWTSLINYAPDDLAGPWNIDVENIKSQSFKLALNQEQHESIFLGGPCFLGWRKTYKGAWSAEWRPLLYREVELKKSDGMYKLIPKQGGWNVTPLLFNFLEKLELRSSYALYELAGNLVEKATNIKNIDDTPLDKSLLKALFSEVPDIESEIKTEPANAFDVLPTPWVLFAPTNKYSALTRNLMSDYEQLESILEKDKSEIGGLKLLEDRRYPDNNANVDVLPLIPLNASQKEAVGRILLQRPLTVISGPPGTGKSQVVVSLLLNAWARGQTVLFASNNNKAVDVVRERVERFESEFPVVVRAGARQKQNVQEILRRTLNMANAVSGGGKGTILCVGGKEKKKKLVEEKDRLQKALETQLPQIIDESRKTALNAYGIYRKTLANIEDIESQLRQQLDKLGINIDKPELVRNALMQTKVWIGDINKYKNLVKSDSKARNEIQSNIYSYERLRNAACSSIGLKSDQVNNWDWLLSIPEAKELSDWEEKVKDYLRKPLEISLEPIEWAKEYDRWKTSEEASNWAEESRKLGNIIISRTTALTPTIERINKLASAVKQEKIKLEELGINEDIDVPLKSLSEWIASYGEYTTRENRKLDWLPWSRKSKLQRNLKYHEKLFRPGYLLSLWEKIGILNDSGRIRLAPVVEETKRWIELRNESNSILGIIQEVENEISGMRSNAAALRFDEIPKESDIVQWKQFADRCETGAEVATKAAVAWSRRVEQDLVKTSLSQLVKEFNQLVGSIPLFEAWESLKGASFCEAIRTLGANPCHSSLKRARSAFYSGEIVQLIESWRKAKEYQKKRADDDTELSKIPIETERLNSWWLERPALAFVIYEKPDEWPNQDNVRREIDLVERWEGGWREFVEIEKPEHENKAKEELKWAVNKLEQAVNILPDGETSEPLKKLVSIIAKEPENDWPINQINSSFSEYNPEKIKAGIERIEAELEKQSFEDAKAGWLERLKNDDEAVRSVDSLEKLISNRNCSVDDKYIEIFKSALRAVPVWITTAQAAQAIPMVPEMFDIVVIDEASQCTLTNLLPLMYRAKSLAVIGDDNQLPAIPNVQETEELQLAEKYEVVEYLPLIGHATNDVYKTATESLPRRRADVIMLDEHFRSNPQIIGFSNRHIYLQRLELKKDPSWGVRLPIGSGVHKIHVSGIAKRGENGRSWVNMPEVQEVVKLIEILRSNDSRTMKIGVVTPFAAQKEILRQRIESMTLSSEILVDTAYGFQGDERDIIIFSPVVAKGITGSASRWVETPPNLINVAVTRAREALFVIADFDYCLSQEGILRKLALYCNDIQLLRDTSPAELELFSWMVVKAWEPKVHPNIGDIEVDFTLESDFGDRLAIEVDGQMHKGTETQDRARDAFLQGKGYDVLRIPAREVMETPFHVLKQIENRLKN